MIVAHQPHFSRHALHDKHPVKRVAMVKGEILQKDSIRCGEIQQLEAQLLGASDNVMIECS